MARQLERYDIEDGLYIYLQDNCRRWYAKFKVGGQWRVRPTKECEKTKAVYAAIRARAGDDALFNAGMPLRHKTFRDVANIAIERMRKVPKTAKGAASMLDYEHTLNKYHIPFFDRAHISNIDYAKLAEFDQWRVEKLGRTPAQSTLKSHNAAMQRVFDVAIQEKWMTAAQVPSLTVVGGINGERRDYFTPREISQIDDFFPIWIAESRKEVTRQIRDLLFFYFQIALHTGIRPGSEMDNLRWNDLDVNEARTDSAITVRKGKTARKKGPRRIPINTIVVDMMFDYSERVDHKDDDLIFRLPNGESSNQLSRNFSALLKRLRLNETAMGKRSLYSLRHTHITLQLLADPPVNRSVLAKHCGTSPEMITQHYDHILPTMFAKQLTENENGELHKLIKKYVDVGAASRAI